MKAEQSCPFRDDLYLHVTNLAILKLLSSLKKLTSLKFTTQPEHVSLHSPNSQEVHSFKNVKLQNFILQKSKIEPSF